MLLKNYAPIGISVDYSTILVAIVQEIEERQFALTEAGLIERFYDKLFDAISNAFFVEINSAKSSIPEKGNKRFLKVFDAMLHLCKSIECCKGKLSKPGNLERNTNSSPRCQYPTSFII